MDVKEQQLRDKYDAAAKRLGPSGTNGEKDFSLAYQQLVRHGYAYQIKKKYRGTR